MNEMFKFVNDVLATLSGFMFFLCFLIRKNQSFLLSNALQLVLDFYTFGFWVGKGALSLFEIDGTCVPIAFLSFDFGGVETLGIEWVHCDSFVLFFEGHVHLSGKPK